MVRITLMDGQVEEVARETVQAIFAWRPIFKNPHLKADGLTYHAGKLVPVNGPLPEPSADSLPQHERPWLLYLGTHVQVIRGLPAFEDDIALNIVPARETAPVLALVPSPEPEVVPEPAAEAPLTLLDVATMISEEDEETTLLRELETLIKVA